MKKSIFSILVTGMMKKVCKKKKKLKDDEIRLIDSTQTSKGSSHHLDITRAHSSQFFLLHVYDELRNDGYQYSNIQNSLLCVKKYR